MVCVSRVTKRTRIVADKHDNLVTHVLTAWNSLTRAVTVWSWWFRLLFWCCRCTATAAHQTHTKDASSSSSGWWCGWWCGWRYSFGTTCWTSACRSRCCGTIGSYLVKTSSTCCSLRRCTYLALEAQRDDLLIIVHPLTHRLQGSSVNPRRSNAFIWAATACW
jgi:hypothetical protein